MVRSVIIRSSVGFGPFKIGIGRSISGLRPETESSLPITSDDPVCYYPVFGPGPETGPSLYISSLSKVEGFSSVTKCESFLNLDLLAYNVDDLHLSIFYIF